MNLTIDPWIPVVWDDGKPEKVSLLAVFQQGDRIRDLAVRPHERIALMRLLICISHAALDGPRDHDEWKTCRERVPQAAADYLAKWKHAFELFGDGQRFLQAPNLKSSREESNGADEVNSPSKFDFALATGNNTTLFDNAGGSLRTFPADVLALLLLTFQNYSPGGLISDVRWNGIAMGRNSTHAPCIVKAMLHTYIRRNSLLDAICANILSRDQVAMLACDWGRPVWECMPEGPQTGKDTENATRTYLGRLVPLSRAVRLSADGEGMIMGRALDYEPEWREPAATWVLRERNGEPERSPLNASLTKSIWREAHAIAILTKTANQMLGGPLALLSLGESEAADVWCGALVASKSKLLDSIESVLHIPEPLFADTGQRLYQQGVQQAERWGRRINRAVAAFHRELHDELDKAEFRNRGNLVKQKATTHYWTAIEQQVPLLLDVLENASPLRREGAAKDQWGGTDWGKALARAARDAYERACPHPTARQFKAYALGLNALFKPDNTESEEDDEENKK